MNKRKLVLLRYLLNNGSEEYKVLEIRKIIEKLNKYKNNVQLLLQDIEFLKHNKYIDVRYMDEINICFAILDNSIIFKENFKGEKRLEKKFIIMLLVSMIFSGVMAFIGSFTAILLFG